MLRPLRVPSAPSVSLMLSGSRTAPPNEAIGHAPLCKPRPYSGRPRPLRAQGHAQCSSSQALLATVLQERAARQGALVIASLRAALCCSVTSLPGGAEAGGGVSAGLHRSPWDCEGCWLDGEGRGRRGPGGELGVGSGELEAKGRDTVPLRG